MRNSKPLSLLLSMGIVLGLVGCNLPAAAPEATPTATNTQVGEATFTSIPESPTQIPETNTATLVPATDTPTMVPPTDTPSVPTATSTNTKVPTPSFGIPVAKSEFEGTFQNGEIVLRIGDNQNVIIPKVVTLRGALCKEGGIINQSISFEPPPTFWITDGKFSMVVIDVISEGDQISISGFFYTSTSAGGSISILLKQNNKKCTIGPLNWNATMVVG